MDPDLFSSIRTLVLDEVLFAISSNLLTNCLIGGYASGGSYKKDIEKILAALKVTRRHKIRDGLVKVTILECLSLPLKIDSLGP